MRVLAAVEGHNIEYLQGSRTLDCPLIAEPTEQEGAILSHQAQRSNKLLNTLLPQRRYLSHFERFSNPNNGNDVGIIIEVRVYATSSVMSLTRTGIVFVINGGSEWVERGFFGFFCAG